ncbi:MAG: hypothetical protein V4550_01730 [Gemmatimonadota bacterium]
MNERHQGTTIQTPSAPPRPGDELRQEIRQSIREAQAAAREAAQEAAQARTQGGGGRGLVIVPPPGGGFDSGIPSGVVDISVGFFVMCAVIIIGWPLARAFGRRIERRSDVAIANPQLTEQLQRIEQAVDAMSIEIERISESQRYMAKLQNERAAVPLERGPS